MELLESCLQTCMTYTNAEELPETCRVSCRRKCGKIGASGWFYYKERHSI